MSVNSGVESFAVQQSRGHDLKVLGQVLVTGGGGFLGRYLARALANAGSQVTVFDDLSCSNSTFDCAELRHDRIRCIEGSVFDRDLVVNLIGGHGTVVHFASVVGVEETISHPIKTVENLQGTLNVVRAVTADHLLLFGSSADVYGAHSHFYDRAMREDDYFLFENGQVNRWVYPHVKALEENLIANSAARSVVIRVFNTYGPAMDFPAPKRVMPHFIDRVLAGEPLELSGNGEQRRSFCHVEDMVAGLMLALSHGAAFQAPFNTCFNLGSPEPITMRDLAEKVVALALELGLIEAPLAILSNSFSYSQKFDDSWNRVPDISRAAEVLNFRPRIPLREGLRRTLAYYKDLQARDSLPTAHEAGPTKTDRNPLYV